MNPREAGRRVKLLDYEVFEALEERDGFALLAIGRPEDEGCFCRVNTLLKDIIGDLADKFDIVLIDGEAGIEQINRRVMKTVDHLVLVSDTSAKGIGVANTIARVAGERRRSTSQSMGLVLNRVRSEAEVEDISRRTGLESTDGSRMTTLSGISTSRKVPDRSSRTPRRTLGVIANVLEKMKVMI